MPGQLLAGVLRNLWQQTGNCNWINACCKKISIDLQEASRVWGKHSQLHICPRHVHFSVHKPLLYCKIFHMLWQSMIGGFFWCPALHIHSCIHIALLCVSVICEIWLCHFEINLIICTSFSVHPSWLDKWFPTLKVFLTFLFQSFKNKTLEC